MEKKPILTFTHHYHDTFKAWYKGQHVDTVEINPLLCVTQAHMVAANLLNKGEEFTIEMPPQSGKYTPELVMKMANAVKAYLNNH